MTVSNDIITEIECGFELDGDDSPYTGKILLSEGGGLSINFDEGIFHQHDFNNSWDTIEGTDTESRNVTVEHAVTSQCRNGWLAKIDTTSVVRSKSADFVPGPNKEVVIEFDILCFQPYIPPIDQIDRNTQEIVDELSDENIPEEKVISYIEADQFEILGVPFVDTRERVDIVKNQGRRMRTGKIRVKQKKHGTIQYHVESAEDEVQKILEISQLVQETSPRYVRAKVVSIDEDPVGDHDVYYEQLKSGDTASVGGRFTPFPNKVLWGDFPEYLRQAYENYTPRIRDELHLRQVLGYYIDARNPDRAVEPKLLSTCSAIELLALWHAREDNISEKTGEKIKHTIDKLDVKTDDLAEQVVPDPDQLDYPEYFWGQARNHAVHGDPDVSIQDLLKAQESALIILKRLLRNQLLGADNDSFENFYDMQPRQSISFGD